MTFARPPPNRIPAWTASQRGWRLGLPDGGDPYFPRWRRINTNRPQKIDPNAMESMRNRKCCRRITGCISGRSFVRSRLLSKHGFAGGS